ncbi:MAG: chaperone modulator CbpM [Bacteroidales bacterium]|jgi:hypothetical protein|nr:chaperone modulator CbpM [Bacteroidales bacterium]
MNSGNLISAIEFCTSHNIEISFINSLQEAGLIKITTLREKEYIHENQLNDLEKIVHLYYDLNINLEGIDTIINLLNRISDLQEEIIDLRNKLRLYEDYDLW